MPTILLIILAILLPPLAVALKVGVTKHFWINLVLLLLVVTAPVALIHALYVVITFKGSV